MRTSDIHAARGVAYFGSIAGQTQTEGRILAKHEESRFKDRYLERKPLANASKLHHGAPRDFLSSATRGGYLPSNSPLATPEIPTMLAGLADFWQSGNTFLLSGDPMALQVDTGFLVIQAGTRIPVSELSFNAVRSSGPGGQNVNKVSTKVTLLFNLATSPSLTPNQKEQLEKRLGSRINRHGILRVSSQEHRSQARNRRAATKRFASLLQEALRQQEPRRPTRKSRQANEKRLRLKKHQGALKKVRSSPSYEEF